MDFRKEARVIRADGLYGNIVKVLDDGECVVKYETGERDTITNEDEADGFKRFYMIQPTVYGNKDTGKALAQELAEINRSIAPYIQRCDQIRKQLWRLQNRMDPEWRKRQDGELTNRPILRYSTKNKTMFEQPRGTNADENKHE